MNRDRRIVVFAGPSLPPHRRPADPVFAWRGPAVAGDALALAETRPAAVVLIDGLFDAWPAIRHKELLELMGRRVPLIGAASMGALRAAELAPFGMVGVGAIFAAYRDGRLVGDDEVALLHAGPEHGWRPLTEALVNVRATLGRAIRARVVSAASARRILAIAAALFYQERTWPRIAEAIAAAAVLAPAAAQGLAAWLAANRVDLKRADALACLDVARAGIFAPRRRPPPATLFTGYLAGQVRAGLRRHPGSPAPPRGTAAPSPPP